MVIESNKLLSILIEQNSFGFTGRINVLARNSGQLLGRFLLKEGEVLFAQYQSFVGFKAIYKSAIDSYESYFLKFIVEPELIEDVSVNLPYDFLLLLKKLNEELSHFENFKNQRPHDEMKLRIRPSFISSGDKIDLTEFELICTLVDCGRVKDLYERSTLLDYEITRSLLSLRKKNALVIA